MIVQQKSPSGDALLIDQNAPLEGMFKRQPHKVKWVTAEIAERFEREYYLVTTAREMLFYLIFLFCATMAVLAKINPNAYYMTAAIKSAVVEEKFYVEGQKYIFKDISTLQDLHTYLVESLAAQLYWTSFDRMTRVQLIPNKDRGVLYSNKLIGEPTMRQVAMGNRTCEIHPRFARHYNLTCKSPFRKAKRLRENLPGCSVSKGCAYGKQDETLAVGYSGTFAHYTGDGTQVYMGKDRHEFIATAESLKNDGWYLQSTRVIFLDFMLFNPNLNLFCGVKLVFELPPVGGVVADSYFSTFKALNVANHFFGHFAIGCLVIYGVFGVYYLAEEIREMVFLKFEYLKLFFSYVDCVLICMITAHLILAVKNARLANNLIKPMTDNSASIDKFSLQQLSRSNNREARAQGLGLFLAYMKLFKYLSLNLVTGQLNNTLKRSGRYLLFFSLIFILMFTAFAEFGYLVFGTEIREYSTLGSAMFTLFRTLLADFDYEKLEKTHPFIAPIFFVLFIFFVFFVLVNMFLAIICGNYTYVKTDMAVGPEIMQMTEFWRRGFHHVCASMKCGICARMLSERHEYNVAAEQIRGILNRCGFSNLDIDVFMARYNIEPENLVKIRDISKLIEYLRVPAAENMTPRKGALPPPPSIPAEQPFMGLEDFKAQQEKLEELEKHIASISDKVDQLLRKLNALKEIRK